MSVIEINEENFESILEKDEIIVMDFWAEWCGPCKAFAPTFSAVAEKNPEITFGKINIDNQQELAATFAVRSIPQVVIMKQKVVVYSESGSMPASALQDLIEQAKKIDINQLQD